jgi:hypothetical protein
LLEKKWQLRCPECTEIAFLQHSCPWNQFLETALGDWIFRKYSGAVMTPTTADSVVADDRSTTAWGAIVAGGIAAAASSIVLFALGVGIGGSVISPWAGEGLSAPTFKVAAGVYMVAIAMLSGTVGGYLTGRMRVRWPGVHRDEVFFRDTAHGFMAWALATVLTATVLGAATTRILGGVTAGTIVGASSAAANSSPVDTYVDRLLRSEPGATPSGAPAASPPAGGDLVAFRGELGRLIIPALGRGSDVSASDRSYLTRLVASRTGISQAVAEQRVSETLTQAKAAADGVRKATAKFALWAAASMLAGALAASLAALEGGALRDSKWWEPGWRRSPI